VHQRPNEAPKLHEIVAGERSWRSQSQGNPSTTEGRDDFCCVRPRGDRIATHRGFDEEVRVGGAGSKPAWDALHLPGRELKLAGKRAQHADLDVQVAGYVGKS
jgi:hypothetical protein